MSNLAPDDDAAAETEPIDPTLPQPATHGQIHVSDAHNDPASLAKQMRAHLAEHLQHLNTTADYGGHGAFGGGGGFAQGGASGSADYQTTGSTTGDADSSGGDASVY
jgi:hypothetical protein